MAGDRKPSFAVVSGVVAVLGVFGWLTRLLEPAIPPIGANAMASEPAEFLRQGGAQRIQWASVASDPFSVARAQDLPLMLVVGVPWSKLGRDLDRYVFTNNDVSIFLRRNFVCARVDASDRPEWLNAYLPVSRSQLGFLPELQIWFLDPRGHMFDLFVRANGDVRVDAQNFLDMLVEVRRRYEGQLTEGSSVTPAAMQTGDVMTIRSPSDETLPNLRAQAIGLQQMIDAANGGMPIRGVQRLWPSAWRFLLTTGNLDAATASLDPVLRTGIVDHLDGGFFYVATSRDWTRIEFDKVAVQQADMMQTLALSGVLLEEPYQSLLAKRTFDSLAGEFMKGGYVRASRQGDEVQLGRSLRSSFSPGDLRDLLWSGRLTDAEAQYARDVLGLLVESNPAMNLRVSDPAELTTKQYEEVVRKLRARADRHQPDFAGEEMLDVNGYVAARMISCARLWNDRVRLRTALELADRLDSFRAGDDVRHTLAPERGDYVYLGDYLGYADAKLQDYLASGRPSSFESGLSVLQRAAVLFKGQKPGLYNVGLSAAGGRVLLPEVVDGFCESLSARMIRLLDAYGRLVLRVRDGKPSADSVQLRRAAFDSATRLSQAAEKAHIGASGYYCAVLELTTEPYAVTVGPSAGDLANSLYRLLPTRLVAAASDLVRSDLQRRKAGTYIVDGLTVQGPMSTQEAAIGLGQGFE